MADKEAEKQVMIEEEKEKWLKHYSSNHQILLVGDGDFSFSLSLALSFGSGSNIVASSLDTSASCLNRFGIAFVWEPMDGTNVALVCAYPYQCSTRGEELPYSVVQEAF